MTNAEAWFNNSLRPRRRDGLLGTGCTTPAGMDLYIQVHARRHLPSAVPWISEDRLFCHCYVLFVSVCVCSRRLGVLVSKVCQRVFNVRNDHSACCTDEGETGIDVFVHVFVGKTETRSVFYPLSTQIRTQSNFFHCVITAAN